MRIGNFDPNSIIPTTYPGMGLTACVGVGTLLGTGSPTASVAALVSMYLLNQYRTRDDRDGYLFTSPLDNLMEDDHKAVSSEITDVLAAYGLPDVRPAGQQNGHVLTRHLVSLPRGTKLGKLPEDDIARDLGVKYVTVSSNAGRGLISLDVPRPDRKTVKFADLMNHEAWQAAQEGKTLPVCPGVDVVGNPFVFDLESAPQLIPAGTTGSGKSVYVNALILSLMHSGADFRLLIADGKNEDFAPFYGNSTKLLHDDGVQSIATEVEDIKAQIKWLVAEMDNRFRTGRKPYPIVFVCDEVADIVMQDDKNQTIVKTLSRIAQKGRSAKIHMVLATQYPSADVLPPALRANIPSRAGLTVSKDYESKVLIGETGCEKLLGKGDCLFKLVGGETTRMHGAMITPSTFDQFLI